MKRLKMAAEIFRRSAQSNAKLTHQWRAILAQDAPLDQLLRSPSAVPFHCVTFSAIMRVDFMAARLSWA
jgi:hypothetical protein